MESKNQAGNASLDAPPFQDERFPSLRPRRTNRALFSGPPLFPDLWDEVGGEAHGSPPERGKHAG